MDKDEVKKIVSDEIRSFVKDSLDDEVKKMIAKSNSPTRGEMIKTIKNALEAVYKMLWMKRDFWKTDIK